MNYAVVIVNWNGAADTVACLASIAASPRARIVVVDNGSTDDSVARITASLASMGIGVQLSGVTEPWGQGGEPRVRVIEAGENLGFAAGSNLGLRIASEAGLPVTVFLNNDTVAEPGALDALVDRLEQDPACFATLPLITVHGTDTVWNCGGRVYSIGVRRYFFAGQPRQEAARHAELRCTFFTGCCFTARTQAFVARGGFSERFFFGEEDFELGLWMKEHGLWACCLTRAVVAHKVSASFSQAAGDKTQPKVFLYYLNRFIHMRLRFGMLRWHLWLLIYLPYMAVLLLKTHAVRARQLAGFLGALVKRARTMERVTRQDFELVMSGQWATP